MYQNNTTKKPLNQNKMTPKEKAQLLYNMFEFNGYVLNESNHETTKKFALQCAEMIRIESENIYQQQFFEQVKQEIINL